VHRLAWIIFWASSGIALVIGGVTVIATDVTNQTIMRLGFALCVLGIGACLVAFFISPAWTAVRQRLARCKFRERSSGELTGIRFPDTERQHLGIPLVAFQTNRSGVRAFKVPNHAEQMPKSIRFVRPRPKTIRVDDLPTEFALGRDYLRVVRFISGGFVVDEQKCIGDDVQVEVFF
jgi:hypothetical protein